MNGEDIFKSIVSGEDQSILGDVARAGLSLLSKGYKKAVTMRANYWTTKRKNNMASVF